MGEHLQAGRADFDGEDAIQAKQLDAKWILLIEGRQVEDEFGGCLQGEHVRFEGVGLREITTPCGLASQRQRFFFGLVGRVEVEQEVAIHIDTEDAKLFQIRIHLQHAPQPRRLSFACFENKASGDRAHGAQEDDVCLTLHVELHTSLVERIGDL